MADNGRCLLLALVGCGGQPEGPTATASCDGVWESAAQPVVTTWCAPCHASTVPEADRRGAPLGMDFDTWEGAAAYADRIAAAAGPGEPRMPPGGGLTDPQRQSLVDWAACGAPGTPEPPAACGERVAWDGAGSPCDTGANTVAGDLVVEADPGASLDCVCEIDGDLVVTGTTATLVLPVLARVGGAVRSDAPGLSVLELPSLVSAGSVALVDPALDALRIDALTTVDGAFEITGGRLPATFGPARLQRTGTDLALRNVAGTSTLELPRLEDVGGSLVVEGLADLGAVLRTSDLVTVGADLRIRGNPKLPVIEDFAYLTQVGGDLEIGGGGALLGIEAFWSLERIGGDLVLRDEPLVAALDGFRDLVNVAGTVELARLGIASPDGFQSIRQVGGVRLVDNPVLRRWSGGEVADIRGDVTISGNTVLDTLAFVDGADRIDGTVTLVDLPALDRTRGFQAASVGGSLVVARDPLLTEVGWLGLLGIEGDLVLEDDPALVSLAGLADLQAVLGNVVIRGNPSLPQAEIAELLGRVTVGGTTTVADNGP